MGMLPPLGLALGGGGVRGGAHIGLLKVLDREEIAVGAIAGTSAGGLVGGLYAAGLSGVEIEHLLVGLTPAAMVRVDRTGWSLVDAGRFFERLREEVGDVRVEDLPRPFCAVAVDLRACREVLLLHGPLVEALRATVALPGLLCPVAHGDALLVDGGVLNNLPVDVARKLGAVSVLALDLGVTPESAPPELPLPTHVFGLLPGPLPRLLRRLLGLTGRQRALAAVARSLNILYAAHSARRLRDDPPDLLLRPSLCIGALEFQRLPEAIAAGERLAEAHLRDIQRLAAGHAVDAAALAPRAANRPVTR